MSWLRRLRSSAFPQPTWEEICALRAALRERESYKIRDGSWYTQEARKETHLIESLLNKTRRCFHLLGG
jgi:hypothetical protein